MAELSIPNQFQLRVQWAPDGGVPAPVNQFQVISGPGANGSTKPDSIIIRFGHVTPPAVPPFKSPEEAEAFAQSNLALVIPTGSFSFSIERLRELNNGLTQLLAAVDSQS